MAPLIETFFSDCTARAKGVFSKKSSYIGGGANVVGRRSSAGLGSTWSVGRSVGPRSGRSAGGSNTFSRRDALWVCRKSLFYKDLATAAVAAPFFSYSTRFQDFKKGAAVQHLGSCCHKSSNDNDLQEGSSRSLAQRAAASCGIR